MELDDFALFAWIPALLVPFAAIYFSLRSSNFDKGRGLFLNSWHVWLVWGVSTSAGFLVAAIVATMFGIFNKLSNLTGTIWFTIFVFLSNLCSISLLLWSLDRPDKNGGLLEMEIETPEPRGLIVAQSIFLTVAAWGSLAILAVLLSCVAAIWEHYYPAPANQFGIYDI